MNYLKKILFLIPFIIIIIYAKNQNLFKFDEISIKGNNKIHSNLILNYIGYNIDSADSYTEKQIIDRKLSVRHAEKLVRQFRDNKSLKLVKKKDVNILELEKTLEEKTGLKVTIVNKKNNTGKIYFEYKDLEQLEFIAKLIKSNN